ncbi:family 78 glycoside hydrolase catalytic domain [Saliphagus sp. LR7]|uniref:family 78 glycoside hydrolase catalytic domain n=1 Tax=Saliphagus sp. LR7 TaxID=2282654 RepID=UPI000DF814F5|nr:family 78 glycoside hydrolase catalytic domain [Saliphagus sp. LR7]
MEQADSGVAATDLRVEHEAEPIDVPPDEPRFSWRGEEGGRGAGQTAYRVLVARSAAAIEDRRGELWDSGKRSTPDSTDVFYDGLPLESGTDYYWSVRLWDEEGEPSAWADVARFSTALEPGEFDGEWIGYRPEGGDSNGYRSRWRRPEEESTERIEIDLGDVHGVERVELHPATPIGAVETPDGATIAPETGFGFPEGVRLEVAGEAGEWETVVDWEAGDGEDDDGAVTIDVGREARQVRVVATALDTVEPGADGSKPEFVREERAVWGVLALAAIAVRDGEGRDLAVGRPITASSSVESESWSQESLTDGSYRSTTAPGSALLRADLSLSGEIARARAHVCGLGYGELSINGERVGDRVLDPAWTQYDERALYSTYDVTDALHEGENILGIQVGRGWFGKRAQDWPGFGSPRAICQVEIEYEDGRSRTLSTDGSWRAIRGPIVENDIYDGETYDARRARSGWDEPGFDDGDWDDARLVEGPGGDLRPQRTPPIRVTETLAPTDVREGDDGPIIDFGQNLVGWVELAIEGPRRGEEVEIRHAETLLPSGELALEDLRSAEATDRYVSDGKPATYEPRFTYHGFRYAQVVGCEVDPEDIRAKVVHTDVDSVGSFDCSNEDLAQVQENARWGLRGNLHGVLTDCPQRDERFGWTGDNQIAARALCYNFDSRGFYEKWMGDHADVQSEHGYVADTIPYGYGSIPEDPTWGVSQVTVPWHLYCLYGDRGVLRDHYEGMRRYVDYWHSVSEEGIVPGEYGNYGDWLAFENTDGRRGLPYDLFNTAFQYHTTDLLARVAEVVGSDADAERYRERADGIARAFTDEFFDPDTGTYGPGTQSSYAVPLYFGLVPDEHEESVAAGLAEKVREDDGKLRTGFLGTRPLLGALVDHGYPDFAYEVASQPERPGWVYMIRQGATTMWERWDSDDRIGDGMNSFNHSPFNFVSEWFYESLAGLRFEGAPRRLAIDPAIPEGLEWADGEIETPDGRFGSRWEKVEGGIDLAVEIPWNTEATVRLPCRTEAAVSETGDGAGGGETLRENGQWTDSLPDGLEPAKESEGGQNRNTGLALVASAGTYRFEIR